MPLKALVPQPNQDVKEVSFEVPVLQEATYTSTFTAFDGGSILAEVVWQPETKKGDSVLLLLFSARILIEEEERLIQKQLEEQKPR